MRRADGGGAEVVQDEVAVGDGVDRVRRDAGEAERLGDHAAVGVEVHAGQRAGAERQPRRSASAAKRSASRSRVEHPDVREQVVREVDGLRALQVRVAGQRPVEVALGRVDQRAPSARSICADRAERRARA